MTKIRKVKRRKTYKVDINRKRLRNKLRKVPTITCSQIKEAWDSKKSTKSNLKQMGLAYDPNQALKVATVKRNQPHGKNKVAQALEAQAKTPRQRMFKLPKGQVQFITYLMEKYGDDFKAMANDKKNYYQLTWKQIRQKVNTFKNIPEQYAEYLVQTNEIVLEDPTPLEETKKKIAEENVKKFCTAKKREKKKEIIGQWIEEDILHDDVIEDIEDEDFDTCQTLNDDEVKATTSKALKKAAKSKIEPLKPDKRLKLFPDDDEEQEKKKVNRKLAEKREELLRKLESSDSEDFEDDNEDGIQFMDLDELSEDELSNDDILDDGEFVTDSDEDEDEEK